MHTPHLDTGYARICMLSVSGQRQVRDELAEDEGPVLRRRTGGPLRGGSCFCHCSEASHAPCWLRARSEGHGRIPGGGVVPQVQAHGYGQSGCRASRARVTPASCLLSPATTHEGGACHTRSRTLATIEHPRLHTYEGDRRHSHGGRFGR
jgi:hypothetical protein